MTTWAQRFRIRGWIRTSTWFIPGIYAVAALGLGLSVPQADRGADLDLGFTLDPDSVRGVLTAVATGMITFTGFVFSIYLVLVQWGSGAFTPRIIRWLGRDVLPKHALGSFIASFLFALTALVEVGRDRADFVPERTILVALGLLLLSVAMFVALIGRVTHTLRVASVTQRLGAEARRVIDDVYPELYDPASRTDEIERVIAGEPVQVVLARSELPSVIVAIDRTDLVRQAERSNAMLRMVPAIGDHVRDGQVLFDVHGAHPMADRKLARAVILGDERTIEHDPLFAARVLVDIAIKALSPTLNDPTTAVQVLDQLSDVLRHASRRRLDMGVVRGPSGRPRLVYPTPGWEDLLALALDEIRIYGAQSIQVMRRMRALLVDLAASVPDSRRRAVDAHLARLERSVERSFTDPDDRADASVADAQGLGLASRG